jgi:nucleoside 2-deoxyribosyltransferase
MNYIYLASPYSHPDAAVRDARFKAACRKAAEYLNIGRAVFSPIAHSHPIADHMDEEKRMDFHLWMKADLPLLRFAKELHVLCIDGWRTSRGVTREIEYADQLGIPVVQVYSDTTQT